MPNMNINALKAIWLDAKKREDTAKADRLDAEKAMLKHVPED